VYVRFGIGSATAGPLRSHVGAPNSRVSVVMLDQPLDRVTHRHFEWRKVKLAPKTLKQFLVGGRFTELPIRTRGVKLVMLLQRQRFN
jgi:hypothetical protein